MIGVVEERRHLDETLQIVHDVDGLHAQLFAVNDVQLLGRIVGQPSFQVLSVFARIQASITQVFQGFGRRVAGSYYLWQTNGK